MKKSKKKVAKASNRKQPRTAPIVRVHVTPAAPPRYECVELQGEMPGGGEWDETSYTDTVLTLARPSSGTGEGYVRLSAMAVVTSVFSDAPVVGANAQFSSEEIDALIAMLQQAKKYFAGGKLKATRTEGD